MRWDNEFVWAVLCLWSLWFECVMCLCVISMRIVSSAQQYRCQSVGLSVSQWGLADCLFVGSLVGWLALEDIWLRLRHCCGGVPPEVPPLCCWVCFSCGQRIERAGLLLGLLSAPNFHFSFFFLPANFCFDSAIFQLLPLLLLKLFFVIDSLCKWWLNGCSGGTGWGSTGLAAAARFFANFYTFCCCADLQCRQNISNFDFFSVAGDYGAGDSRRSTTDNERAPFHRFQRRRRLREKIAPDCLFSPPPPPPPLIITPLIFTVSLSHRFPVDQSVVYRWLHTDSSALCSLLYCSSQSCTLLELCIFSLSLS